MLGVAIPVLSTHIDAMKSGDEARGLTERQIEVAFAELSPKFGKSDYHSTYLHEGWRDFSKARGVGTESASGYSSVHRSLNWSVCAET